MSAHDLLIPQHLYTVRHDQPLTIDNFPATKLSMVNSQLSFVNEKRRRSEIGALGVGVGGEGEDLTMVGSVQP